MGIGFSFSPDVSPATQARRREFLPLKKSFVQERAVQASVLSPAKLYVVFMRRLHFLRGIGNQTASGQSAKCRKSRVSLESDRKAKEWIETFPHAKRSLFILAKFAIVIFFLWTLQVQNSCLFSAGGMLGPLCVFLNCGDCMLSTRKVHVNLYKTCLDSYESVDNSYESCLTWPWISSICTNSVAPSLFTWWAILPI